MKNCFKEEIEKTIKDIKSKLTKDDLCFAMLCDTHLSDEGEQTRENIKAVDNEIGFDFIVHLGNIINGDNPEGISRYLLECELEKYKKCVSCEKLFVSQGNTDGWRDETFMGQLAKNIVTNEMWHDETSYIDLYDNVKRPGNKPYYYVDFPKKNVRLIFLCSYNYQIDTTLGLYEKYLRIDVEQAAWLMKEALVGCEGMEVFLFSHKMPKSRFENGENPFIYNGFSTEPILAIIQQAQRRGVNVACWFGGGYGFDSEIKVANINHAVINSQLPRTVTTANTDDVRFAENRDLNTVNQDCWDVVVLKKNERTVNIYRFGCGKDRTLHY